MERGMNGLLSLSVAPRDALKLFSLISNAQPGFLRGSAAAAATSKENSTHKGFMKGWL